MAECVGLLRGINVGRAKRIAMADLRRMLEGLGFTDVRTLLNSGNAVFRSPRGGTADLAAAIERGIRDRFGLSVPVVVVTAKELGAIVEENPLARPGRDPSRQLVAFVDRPRSLAAAKGLASRSWSPGEFAIGRRAAYLWCPGGIAASEMVEEFYRVAGPSATMRNWATVLKLQAMVTGSGPAD